MAKPKPKTRTIVRDARTGEFTRKEEATRRPDTTVTERLKNIKRPTKK